MIKHLISTIVLFTAWFLMYLFYTFNSDINQLLALLCLTMLLSLIVTMVTIILNNNEDFYHLEKSNTELREKLDEIIKELKK